MYCNNNFVEDPDENMECKQKSDFCFMCCDNEFGSYNTLDRVNCLKECQFNN